MNGRLVAVSNRVSIPRKSSAPGGLAVGLLAAMRSRGGLWFGWSGELTEEEANSHPQSNLLTGCLGTLRDPPLTLTKLGRLEVGDSVMACSDGLWHYFSPMEIGTITHALPPREASEMLIGKARDRAHGGGDNLSLALVRVDPLG